MLRLGYRDKTKMDLPSPGLKVWVGVAVISRSAGVAVEAGSSTMLHFLFGTTQMMSFNNIYYSSDVFLFYFTTFKAPW